MVNEYVWTQKHSVTDLKVGKALSKGGSKWESLGNLRFAQGKPLNPKLIHVQKRPPRRLEGVHRPWFG